MKWPTDICSVFKKKFMSRLTIKYKLFITYATVSLVIFSLSFALFFCQTRDSLDRRIKDELQMSNQIVASMVETAATIAIKNHLKAIAEKNYEIVAALYDEYRKTRITEAQAMDRAIQILMSQQVGDTGYIYCINSNGVAVVHRDSAVLGNNFSYRRFIQTQISEKKGYLEYRWKNSNEKTEKPKALYMVYFAPWDWIISVSSYKSEFSKLIDVGDFESHISGLTFGETGYAFLFDINGDIISHPKLSGGSHFTQDDLKRQIIDNMLQRKTGFLTYSCKNPSENRYREKVVAFDTIKDFNWIIGSSSYKDEIFSPLVRMQNSFWKILTVALLLIGWVTLFISASITKPLQRLIQQFEQGAEGGKSVCLPKGKKDEISRLTHSFNLFMTHLDASRREIAEKNIQRKKVQEHLYSLQQYLTRVIDAMPSVIIGIDKNFTVTQWNIGAQKETGIDLKTAQGRHLFDIYPRMEKYGKLIRDSLSQNTVKYSGRQSYQKSRHEVRYEDLTVYSVSTGGHSGAVIRIDDTTNKVMMEEALIQNEKMMSLGGLAAGMAHEINNPLAGVIQNIQVLVKRLSDETLPVNIKAAQESKIELSGLKRYLTKRKLDKTMEAIHTSGQRISDIVNNMLSFARKSDASLSPCDLANLMDKTLMLVSTDYNLKKQYDVKSIRIQKDYDTDLPLVTCDAGKIQQVFMNILTNGAQALCGYKRPDKSPLQLSIQLRHDEESGFVYVRIADNGPGMDKNTKKKIFEPFFTTKPIGVGTGLGLSVSYFIITKNHGGTLSVSTRPGKGSVFKIGLPIKKAN